MSHLGRWLSALVDGELDDDERDHVLNHLAGCAACRQEANALRALKRRMTALGEGCGDVPIAGRLIELSRRAPQLPQAGGPPGPARAWPSPGRPAPWRALPSRRGWTIAGGSAAALVVAIGLAAFLLGGTPAPAEPKVTPAVDAYWIQHSYDTGQVPAASIPSRGGAAGSPGRGAAGPGPAPTSARPGQAPVTPAPAGATASPAATSPAAGHGGPRRSP